MNKEETIIFKLKTVSNLVKRRIQDIINKNHNDNITPTQGLIARYLHDNTDKDIFQKDLEEKFCIRRSTVTNILNLMEKNELIIREKVPYDARLKKIVLTEKSIKIHAKICNEILEVEKELLKDLSKDEYLLFSKILDKMKNNLV